MLFLVTNLADMFTGAVIPIFASIGRTIVVVADFRESCLRLT